MSRGVLKVFFMPILLALILGFLADAITTAVDSPGPIDFCILLILTCVGTHTFVFGFSLISPVAVLLLLILFRVFDVKSKILIISATTILFLFAMVFGFWFYAFRIGYVSHMYGLLYLLGTIPSVVIGILFGFYLTRRLQKLPTS